MAGQTLQGQLGDGQPFFFLDLMAPLYMNWTSWWVGSYRNKCMKHHDKQVYIIGYVGLMDLDQIRSDVILYIKFYLLLDSITILYTEYIYM